MTIQITCSACHARFKVSDKFAGRKGPCPKCKAEITIPRKEVEVVIKPPEQFGGSRDSSGQLALKPIERADTSLTPLRMVALVIGIAAIFIAAIGVGSYHAGHEVPFLIKAVGAMALAPPLTFLGYSFLRDTELEPYRGSGLLLRVIICGAVYATLWGVFAEAAHFFFSQENLESWNALMLVLPIVFFGGLTAFASLDLTPTNAFFHYAFYVTVTAALRCTAGMSPF